MCVCVGFQVGVFRFECQKVELVMDVVVYCVFSHCGCSRVCFVVLHSSYEAWSSQDKCLRVASIESQTKNSSN